VDLDPRDGSRDVGNEAAENPEIVRPEPVGEVMEPDGVETRVAEEDLEHAARGGSLSKMTLMSFRIDRNIAPPCRENYKTE